MELDIIMNKLNTKYYKAIKHYLDKNQKNSVWLNKFIEVDKKAESTSHVNTEKKLVINQSESENHKQIFSDEDLYKKSWVKLNPIHKILKIKQFVNDLKFNSEKDREELKEQLIELVKNKILTKKEKVRYDDVNGKIISLTDLQYKNGKYYIE
jgi:hypothetical protein